MHSENEQLRVLEARAAGCLREAAAGHPGLAVAFSGGLDSRLLVHLALRAGLDVAAYHLAGPHVPRAETSGARLWAAARGIYLCALPADVLADADVAANGPERCYFCKRRMFSALRDAVGDMPLCDGTNASDLGVYRPGLKALGELGIISPLARAGLTKDAIHALARLTGLDNPAQRARPCLLTRFQYGLRPSAALLERLAGAEAAIAGMLLRHGMVAAPGREPAEAPEAADFRLRAVAENSFELHLALAAAPQALRRDLEAVLTARGFAGAPLRLMDTVSGYYDTQRPRSS